MRDERTLRDVCGEANFYWDNQREPLRGREVNGYAESADN